MANASSVTELQEKLPLRAKLGYGTIGLSTMANVMFATWQMFFYTTFAGIDIATAGMIVSVGRLLRRLSRPCGDISLTACIAPRLVARSVVAA